MALAISTVVTGDQRRFDDLMRIYQDSIEPSEQKPPSEMAKLLQSDKHEFLVASKAEVVIGFAMLFYPAGVECWLLDYMATGREFRSSGAGAALFAAACERALLRRSAGVGLIEVDKPLAGSSTFDDALRRQRFYARHGCRLIAGLDYLLPKIGVGTPPPMQLLLHQPTSSAPIAKAVLSSWLSALYTQLYSCRADDPRIASMLAPLPSVIELEELV